VGHVDKTSINPSSKSMWLWAVTVPAVVACVVAGLSLGEVRRATTDLAAVSYDVQMLRTRLLDTLESSSEPVNAVPAKQSTTDQQGIRVARSILFRIAQPDPAAVNATQMSDELENLNTWLDREYGGWTRMPGVARVSGGAGNTPNFDCWTYMVAIGESESSRNVEGEIAKRLAGYRFVR